MKAKGRLLELDCLRGIAAILVVIFHFTTGRPNLHIFNWGCMGVELFFMISGFVIFLTIEKTNNYKSFLLSRFARLYPAYWACVTLTTLSIISWSLMAKVPVIFPDLKDYLINLTMFQYYFKVKDIDGVYWTLIIELLFYLFILIVYLSKAILKIEIICFFLVLACLIYGTMIRAFAPDVYGKLAEYFPIIVYFPLFAAGIVFYKIKFYKATLYRFFLVLLCLITQVFLFEGTGKIVSVSKIQYASAIFIFFALFLLYCFDRLHFIINKVTLFAGKISYSLYLIHGYISVYLLIPILTHSSIFHINYWVAILFFVAPIVFIAATLINKFIEIPAMKYLKRKMLPTDQKLTPPKLKPIS
ncbi:MAG TPA: acyltransferase [Mucilaginibacter sp.]|nr:acyltransferase [Mucilaginibacter sp.]